MRKYRLPLIASLMSLLASTSALASSNKDTKIKFIRDGKPSVQINLNAISNIAEKIASYETREQGLEQERLAKLAQKQAEEEAKLKAKEEAKIALEERKKAEALAKEQARIAKEEAKLAEQQAKLKAKEEARLAKEAEKQAKLKLKQEIILSSEERKKAKDLENEQAKVTEEAAKIALEERIKAEEAAKEQAQIAKEEAKLAAREAKLKAKEEARLAKEAEKQARLEARLKAKEEARIAKEAKKQAEEAAKIAAAAEAASRAEASRLKEEKELATTKVADIAKPEVSPETSRKLSSKKSKKSTTQAQALVKEEILPSPTTLEATKEFEQEQAEKTAQGKQSFVDKIAEEEYTKHKLPQDKKQEQQADSKQALTPEKVNPGEEVIADIHFSTDEIAVSEEASPAVQNKALPKKERSILSTKRPIMKFVEHKNNPESTDEVPPTTPQDVVTENSTSNAVSTQAAQPVVENKVAGVQSKSTEAHVTENISNNTTVKTEENLIVADSSNKAAKVEPVSTVGNQDTPTQGPEVLVINFNKSDTEVSSNMLADLSKVAEELRNDKTKKVRVVGYASSNNSEKSFDDRQRALARVISVRKYMIDNGVTARQINVQAVGKDQSRPANSDRVEIGAIQ